MRKIAVLSLLALSALFAASDKDIEQFLTNNYKKNPGVQVKSIKILGKEKIGSYDAYRYLAELNIQNANNVKIADIVFAKDNMIMPELFELPSGKSLKDEAKPKLPASAYNDAHFVVGSKNAQYKIVIFSDPFCPFCKDLVPDLISAAEKNPNKIAIWHYSFPLLNIHPAAETAVKAEIAIGNKMSLKEKLLKLYKLDTNAKETSESKILADINKDLKQNLTAKDLSSKSVTDKYNSEVDFGYQMIIRGTPSAYVNGAFDSSLANTKKIMEEK